MIKQIKFYMANADTYTLDGSHIGDFLCDNIRSSITRIDCENIEYITEADLVIEVAKAPETEDFIKRVGNSDDITSFDIIMTNGEEYSYFVEWGSTKANCLQSSYVSDLGNLYLIIGIDKVFGSYFDAKDINDEKYMDDKFKAYGIIQ